MLKPITPAVRLAHDIEARAMEVEVIRKLLQIARDTTWTANANDSAALERERNDVDALLGGALAMMADLIEDLGKVTDSAFALDEPSRRAPAPPIADAA